MSSRPRIVVLKMREIIYTVILLFLAVLLVVCLVLMFSGKAKKEGAAGSATSETPAAQSTEETQSQSLSLETASYTPGVYTTPVTLGSSAADVEVTVDSDRINAIRLVNLSETTAAAYPLVSPSLDHIASQILEKQSLTGITCPQENRYTSQLLLSAIAQALELAQSGS